MKRGLSVGLALIVVFCTAAAFASSQPVGGVATAQPGKVDLSAGYFYSQDKWESSTFSGEGKIKTNMYYGQIGYGVAPGWDIYLRAGVTDAKGDSNLDLSSNGKFFAGAGFHGRLFQYQPWNLSFGPVGNVGFYENWSGNVGFTDLKLKDHYSFDLGFGFQWKPMPELTVFGGPFYHYDTAKLEVERGFFSDSAYIHTKKSFGPRLGVNVMLTKELYLQIEGQSREYISGGASIGYNF
jgi:hypothetical protein